MSLNDLLQAEAFRLGFMLFGAARVQPPPHVAEYKRWVVAGRHASMAYLATERALERRAHPNLILPEATSLLVVAMRYFAPQLNLLASSSEALGRVAAYAWGADYHEIIPPRLAELIALIQDYLGRPVRERSYTDTGPILERDFAQTAGLGWIGKNTCLISPQHGSYFLLGESFLDVEIEPSPPFQSDQCGACRRCIEACPTDCILPDRTIDATRCISYLTIENKGPIPPELRPQMDNWVFGCDICQMVCPWNVRFAQPEGHPALAPYEGVSQPVLREELGLTPQAFNLKFRRSPIKRAKRRGYLRNIAVALGNQADPGTIPDLANVLQQEAEPLVRAHAAWALGRMHARQARQALDKAFKQETDTDVRIEVLSALDSSA